MNVTDERKGKEKAFESIPHKHGENPKRNEVVNCERCKYDQMEASIPKANFKIKQKNKDGIESEKTITSIKVKRGKLDDCIGWTF